MSTKNNRLINLKKLKRLSEFSIEELIISFGIYESALVYLRDVDYLKPYEDERISTDELPHVNVSPDVDTLNKLLTENSKYMLPCPVCLREQPFNPTKWGNPSKLEYRGVLINPTSKPVSSSMQTGKHNVFEVSEPFYRIGNKLLCDINDNDVTIFQKDNSWNDFLDTCVRKCKDTIIGSASEIRRDYFCGYDSSHRVFVNFRIYDPIMPDDIISYSELLNDCEKNKELIEAYEYLRDCLIIQKVGQYPSLADMQMFDVEKYRTILGKENYRDLTRAIGLRADGIGAGAFLYLRRVLERLVEEKHQEVLSDDGWDEQTYKEARFDERIKILEKQGIIIFPDGLKQVKGKIYGVLSKGVHESSDNECNELFSYVEFSIEQILDEQIKQKELNERIKRLNLKLG